MNVKEGMRRLGLVVGTLGATAGAVVSYTNLQPLLIQRGQYRAFQSLVSSSVVQKEVEFLKRDSVKHRLPSGAKPILPEPRDNYANMPPGTQRIEFNGVVNDFPPDFTDAEIKKALIFSFLSFPSLNSFSRWEPSRRSLGLE
jgi:hypothetical protein